VNSLLLSIALTLIPPPELLSQNYELWVEQLKNPSPDIRITSLNKLSEIRKPETLAKMAECLGDSMPEVRFTTIKLFGRIQTEESAKFLKTALENEKDPYLVSELKRNIRAIEDGLKAAEKEKEKAAEKAEEKAKRPAKPIKPIKSEKPAGKK
jgi:HEAT repeat protein